MSLLPLAIILLIILIIVLGYAARLVIISVRENVLLPKLALVLIIVALALLACVFSVVIALTVGLSHSRSPFEYTKFYSAAGAIIIFVLPSIVLLLYQWRTFQRQK